MVKRMTTPAAYRHGNGSLIESRTDSAVEDGSVFIPKKVGSDRRMTQRFPIELSAELCIRAIRIPGTTVNISSGGLLIKCSHDSLQIGRRVKVKVTNWPNSSGTNSEIALVIDGAVVRDSNGYVAVRRTRYEFVED
jgi:hypothetical protein